MSGLSATPPHVLEEHVMYDWRVEATPPRVLEEHVMYDWRGTFSQLYLLLKEGTLCDLTLRTGGGSVHVHCVVLYARVPYFQAMFQFNRSRVEEADLSDYSKSTVDMVVQFIYTGQTRAESLDDLLKVFSLADYLQITNLVKLCEERIFELFCYKNCIDIANFAAKFSTSIGQSRHVRIKKFFLTSWNHILSKVPCWTALEYGTFHALVISDEFNVRNEEQVLSGVLQWVAAESGRRDKLQSLLQDVRLHVIADEVLSELERSPLVTSSTQCLRLISEGRDFASKIRCGSAATIKLRHRNYFDKCIYVYCQYKAYPEDVRFPKPSGEGGGCTQNGIQQEHTLRYNAAYQEYFNNCNILIFSKTHDRWEQHLDSIQDNGEKIVMSWAEETPIAALGDCVYSIGNRQWYYGSPRDEDDVYNQVHAFDRLMQAFVPKGLLPFPVMFNACGSLDNRLFTCGGVSLAGPRELHRNVATLLISDEEVSFWDSAAEMSCPRSNHSAVMFNDKIYVTGGEVTSNELDGCAFSETWDPTLDKWSEFPNPTNNRTKLSICSRPGKLMVLGGFCLDELHDDFTWECYDPREGTWTTPQPIPRHSGFSTACLENEVYLLGGETWNKSLSCNEWSRDVHVLDVRMEKWREGHPLPLRNEPHLCDVDSIFSEIQGDVLQRTPRPTGAVTFG